MKQLTQKLGSGDMAIQEVPPPKVGKRTILVKNHYSLISPGTEGATVSAARKNLLSKAKEKPKQVKQVLEVLKNQGPVETYRAVTKKLDSYSPLGYSSSGEVLAVGEEVGDIKKGDYVACAGAGYANHSEIISVPENLCVKLDDDSKLKEASYNTLGAIALQGVRQADLRIGENCAVIGLGLLGQLACSILQASGVKTIGVDINDRVLNRAKNHCLDIGFLRSEEGITEKIFDFTDGIGIDKVIIAAATDSLDPVNFAGSILRKKGEVIILGDVPTGFDREPDYYKKELGLKMSCSYGPGRYDPEYEEKGNDYPVGYVRWTERRNMKAFQDLVYSEKIDPSFLTTHEYNFANAPKAYDLILNGDESYLGIVLQYNIHKNEELNTKLNLNQPSRNAELGLAVIGAGSYAQGKLLPNLPDTKKVSRKGVLSNTGTTSKRVAEKFDFEFCTSNEEDLFDNLEINSVIIATRHNTHAGYVLEALERNMNVYVEKPLCLTPTELDTIKEVYSNGNGSLFVGFNRRFSPLTKWIKEKIPPGKMSMIYRVNAGSIPKDNWIQDKEIGGGRIIGEVCHFVDYLTFINGSLPQTVYASSVNNNLEVDDIVNVNIEFENGSSGTVSYFSNGSKSLSKERVEIYKNGTTGIIEDFKKAKFYSSSKKTKRLFSQDKGQKDMLNEYFTSLEKKSKLPMQFESIEAVTKTTFAIEESIKMRDSITI